MLSLKVNQNFPDNYSISNSILIRNNNIIAIRYTCNIAETCHYMLLYCTWYKRQFVQ